MSTLTDDLLNTVSHCLGGLREISLYGCRRVTDQGLIALSGSDCPNLRWLNATGAYKVSDGGYRCLLSSHPSLLLYSKPNAFYNHETS